MSDDDNNDGFEELINSLGSGDEDDTETEFETPMDVLAHYWKAFHPGNIFVKGILIVESATTDGRTLRYQTSTPISEWETLGMLECVKQQINAQGVVEYLTTPYSDDDDQWHEFKFMISIDHPVDWDNVDLRKWAQTVSRFTALVMGKSSFSEEELETMDTIKAYTMDIQVSRVSLATDDELHSMIDSVGDDTDTE